MESLKKSEPAFEPFHTAFDFSKYQNDYEIGRTRIIEKLVPEGHGGLAVDVGCGPGYFSRLLTARGWKTTAIDTDADNIESARDHADETHLGSASAVFKNFRENQFDLVVALEIIEHMPKSRGETLIHEFMRTLKPGGKLILSTPNRFSPEGLWGYYWGEKIRNKKWDAWDETHVHIYSSAEIIRLLETSGFMVDAIMGYYYEGGLPFGKRWRLPFTMSTRFPFNRLGFNIVLECHKK